MKVTYDAGFTIIPAPVQLACAELTKAIIERFRQDHQLESENISGAGSQAYKIAVPLIGFLPRPVLQGISLYRIHRAY